MSQARAAVAAPRTRRQVEIWRPLLSSNPEKSSEINQVSVPGILRHVYVLWRTKSSRPRLKFRLKFWIAVWPWAQHLHSLVLLCFTSKVRLQDCPSTSNTVVLRLTRTGSIWSVTIMPAVAVSSHSHHKGQFKFLEETLKEGLFLFHDTSCQTPKSFSILPIVWMFWRQRARDM